MPELLYRNDRAELWLGDSLALDTIETVMSGRVANALIFDGPFSPKTHEGHKNGKLTADRAAAFGSAKLKSNRSNAKNEQRYSAKKAAAGESGRNDIDYACFTAAECLEFCNVWVPHCSGWCVSITDDVLAPEWRRGFEQQDLYAFTALPLVETGSRVRMTGDGPSGWTCWIMVARPKNREFASWGTLPGAYIQPGERNSNNGTNRIVGGKPLKSMIDIVSDYSRDGELVVDPFCGAATTGLAALRTGRRFIGIEKDPERAKLCAEILAAESKLSNRREIAAGQATLFNV